MIFLPLASKMRSLPMIDKTKASKTVGQAFNLRQETTRFVGEIGDIASVSLTKAQFEDKTIDEKQIKSAQLSYNHSASNDPKVVSALGCFENMLGIDGFSIIKFIEDGIAEMGTKETSSVVKRVAQYQIEIHPDSETMTIRADCVSE